ncbi:MAG: hypothetical protein ACXABY_08755 [Candidatus Thorarchaeota archaeon]|jgi:hypothetical protein
MPDRTFLTKYKTVDAWVVVDYYAGDIEDVWIFKTEEEAIKFLISKIEFDWEEYWSEIREESWITFEEAVRNKSWDEAYDIWEDWYCGDVGGSQAYYFLQPKAKPDEDWWCIWQS